MPCRNSAEINLKMNALSFGRHCLPLRSQWTRFVLPDMCVHVSQVLIHCLAVMQPLVPMFSFLASFGTSKMNLGSLSLL